MATREMLRSAEGLLRRSVRARTCLLHPGDLPRLRHPRRLHRSLEARSEPLETRHVRCNRQFSRFLTTPAASDQTAKRDENDNLEHLERLTYWALSSPPLGTMTESELKQTCRAIRQWCDPQRRVLTGYQADSADRLLRRLVSERATESYQARALLHADEITDLHLLVFESFLSMDVELALDRAQNVVTRWLDWYHAGRIQQSPSPPLLDLLQHRMDRETVHSLQCAVELLMDWTRKEARSAKREAQHELTALFHQAVEQAVQLRQTGMARDLLKHMEWLTTHADWDGLQVSEQKLAELSRPKMSNNKEEIDVVATTHSATSVAEETAPSELELSELELEVMQEQLLKVLQTASAKEQGKVMLFWNKLQASMPSSSRRKHVAPKLCRALVRYFVRVENVVEATAWLRRLDMATKEDHDDDDDDDITLAEDFTNVLQLWAATKDQAAPWRAEELVRRMEEIEVASGDAVASNTVYNLLLRCWGDSGVPNASEKMASIFLRMTQSGDAGKAPNAETYRLMIQSSAGLDESSAKMIASKIKDEWKSLDSDVLVSLMDSLFEALAQHGLGNEAKELLQMTVAEGFETTPQLRGNVVRAQATLEEKLATQKLMEELAVSDGGGSSLEAYEQTIVFAMGSRKPGSFMKAMELVGKALDLHVAGKLASTDEEITAIMEKAIRRLKYLERATDADTLLQYLEAKTLLDDSRRIGVFPSLSCFNNVMKAWADAGRVEKVRETLNRLLGYYEAGYTSLLPSTASFGTYLLCLSDDAVGAANEAEEMLDRMIALYESTSDASCKPNVGTFNAVLVAWKKEKNQAKAERSLALLDRMLSLGIHPQSFTFDTIMLTLLRSPLEDKYHAIVALLDRMKTLNLEPQSFTHNIILDACAAAREDEKEEALNRAQSIFGHLRETKAVGGVSYMSFLKTVDNLMSVSDPRRAILIESTFRTCEMDGFLEPNVKRKFDAMRKKKRNKNGREDAVDGTSSASAASEAIYL